MRKDFITDCLIKIQCLADDLPDYADDLLTKPQSVSVVRPRSIVDWMRNSARVTVSQLIVQRTETLWCDTEQKDILIEAKKSQDAVRCAVAILKTIEGEFVLPEKVKWLLNKLDER